MHPGINNASRARPRILEIGFGMGETTAAIAQLRPEDDFWRSKCICREWAHYSSALAK